MPAYTLPPRDAQSAFTGVAVDAVLRAEDMPREAVVTPNPGVGAKPHGAIRSLGEAAQAQSIELGEALPAPMLERGAGWTGWQGFSAGASPNAHKSAIIARRASPAGA